MLLRTACPLDCPDTCSLQVEVEPGTTEVHGRRLGRRLLSVDAAPTGADTNPFTDGWICKKVKGHADRVHGPDRILTPLVRTSPKGTGGFRPVSWDEALDLIAERCLAARDEHGAESVVPYLYNSSGGALAEDGLTPLLWRQFGASRMAHTICAATAGGARRLVVGELPSADPATVLDAALVVIWGANPTVSNTHWAPLVNEARRNGAAVVVVDPRRTATAGRADLHVAPHPGTDVALALALATRLVELDGIDRAFVDRHVDGLDEYLAAAAAWPLDRAASVCGVAVEEIDRLAHLLAERRPALFRLGWGLERNRNGGSAWRAALSLPALTGNFGRPGAGAYWSTSSAFPWDGSSLEQAVLDDAPAAGRWLNQNRLGPDLLDSELDPPVRVLFVQGANPAVMCPDQVSVLAGLARDDLFTVVHDQVRTDTVRFADVVLPATTHFEATDVSPSYGSFGTEAMRPVIERVGESRTNDEVATALAVRFGYDPYRFDPDPSRLLTLGGHDADIPGWRPIDVGPQQPDRISLVVEDAESSGVDRVPVYRPLDDRSLDPRHPLDTDDPPGTDYPLALLTPANPRTINSIFGERGDLEATVSVHPDDAAARGITDGDRVRVHDARASITVVARIDGSVRPGVVSIPKGLWHREVPEGLGANAFSPATLSDVAGGACFHDARVEVTPA
jgi:anaerobic selenocysteine-containing dehydrogenase